MAGASYEIGKATVYGGFSAVKWADLGIDSRVYGLSVKYQFNPANYVALGYAYLHDQSSHGNHADQVGLMYEYDLSKRTSFYGALSYLRNRKQAGYTLAGAANPGLPLAYPGRMHAACSSASCIGSDAAGAPGHVRPAPPRAHSRRYFPSRSASE